MDTIFEVHILNDSGIDKAKTIDSNFQTLLENLTSVCSVGREFAIVKTKLEEACFFAKKSMANDKVNQR